MDGKGCCTTLVVHRCYAHNATFAIPQCAFVPLPGATNQSSLAAENIWQHPGHVDQTALRLSGDTSPSSQPALNLHVRLSHETNLYHHRRAESAATSPPKQPWKNTTPASDKIIPRLLVPCHSHDSLTIITIFHAHASRNPSHPWP
uniref:Uncharacterized protein n=1 Tax=Bionectria ochroleuca TaxID=29856 RepID=A0A8H7NLQ9_BIOOC